jgi:hypothetical protein
VQGGEQQQENDQRCHVEGQEAEPAKQEGDAESPHGPVKYEQGGPGGVKKVQVRAMTDQGAKQDQHSAGQCDQTRPWSQDKAFSTWFCDDINHHPESGEKKAECCRKYLKT